MGRTADVERLKLRALYCNNVAAGLTVGGCVVPFIGVARSGNVVGHVMTGTPVTFTEKTVSAVDVVGLVLAFSGAWWLRRRAARILSDLPDE